VIDWTEIYRDTVRGEDVVFVRGEPGEGVIDLADVKPCRIIPCPGSYFPGHDEQCEMVWDEEDFVFTECACEPRARAVRDAS
jgi:hypothetical protein